MGNTWGQGSTHATRKARAAALQRDQYQCQLRYTGCTHVATEADHIVNIATLGITRAAATDLTNLQAVCHQCHTVKTRRESREEKAHYAAAILAQPVTRSPRARSPHPGD